jgi:hypothetical protein
MESRRPKTGGLPTDFYQDRGNLKPVFRCGGDATDQLEFPAESMRTFSGRSDPEFLTFSPRGARLVDELRSAYASAPPGVMLEWAGSSSARLGTVLVRRGRNVLTAVAALGRLAGNEVRNFSAARQQGASGAAYLGERLRVGGSSSTAAARRLREDSIRLYRAFCSNPGEVGPKLIVLALDKFAPLLGRLGVTASVLGCSR